MTIKGLNQLLKHLPGLDIPLEVVHIFLLPVILVVLVTVTLDAIPLAWPFGQVVAEILSGALGFGLLFLFFRYRQDFKARFGPRAYERAAGWLGLPRVTIIAAAVAHIRVLPGPGLPAGGGVIIVQVLGWALLLAGALLALRTVQVFGVDNLVMLYVYFPKDSQLVSYQIYTILRHPAYTAVLLIVYGLALLNGSWAALTCALIFSLGLWGWVNLVEEKELIQRFGPSYAEYRQRAPAFWPRLSGLGGLFRFMLNGK